MSRCAPRRRPRGPPSTRYSRPPPDQATYLRVYNQYEPLWKLLTPEASEKVRKGNYLRIFDEARRKVRSWEATHVK